MLKLGKNWQKSIKPIKSKKKILLSDKSKRKELKFSKVINF